MKAELKYRNKGLSLFVRHLLFVCIIYIECDSVSVCICLGFLSVFVPGCFEMEEEIWAQLITNSLPFVKSKFSPWEVFRHFTISVGSQRLNQLEFNLNCKSIRPIFILWELLYWDGHASSTDEAIKQVFFNTLTVLLLLITRKRFKFGPHIQISSTYFETGKHIHIQSAVCCFNLVHHNWHKHTVLGWLLSLWDTFPQFISLRMTAAHDRFTVSLSTSCGSTVHSKRQLAHAHTYTHSLSTWGPVTNRHNDYSGTWEGDRGTHVDVHHYVDFWKTTLLKTTLVASRDWPDHMTECSRCYLQIISSSLKINLKFEFSEILCKEIETLMMLQLLNIFGLRYNRPTNRWTRVNSESGSQVSAC